MASELQSSTLDIFVDRTNRTDGQENNRGSRPHEDVAVEQPSVAPTNSPCADVPVTGSQTAAEIPYTIGHPMEASPPAVPVEMSALSAIGGDSRAGYGNVEDGDTSEEWFFSPPAFDAEDDKDMVVKYLSRKNSGRTWDSTMTCGLKAMDRRRSFTVEPTLYEKLTLNKFGYAFNNASCAIGGGLFFKIIPLHFHQPRVPIGVRVAEQGNLLQERALRLQSRGFFPGLFPFYHLDDEELSWEFFDPPDYEEWSSESDEI